MEILAERTEWAGYIAVIALCVLIAIVSVVAAISVWKDGRRYGYDIGYGLFTLFFLALAIGALASAIIFGMRGPEVYYDVIITDWNTVYEGGYNIEEQNGKIVTLTKE